MFFIVFALLLILGINSSKELPLNVSTNGSQLSDNSSSDIPISVDIHLDTNETLSTFDSLYSTNESTSVENTVPTITTTARTANTEDIFNVSSNSSKTLAEKAMISTEEFKSTTNMTTVPPKSAKKIDKTAISGWFPFIFILSLLLFCLVGIDPQQDLHLESLDMN